MIDSVIQQIKKGVRFFIRNILKLIISCSLSRRLLNVVYLMFTPSQRNFFYLEFAKIFRNTNIRGNNGFWKVIFHGKKIIVPLTSKRLWLDWDCAVSIIGHDIEVKETYDALINSSEPPELFIDIGANYGTHSLLFLVNHIKTITFEPNNLCRDYFSEICKLNQVIPNLEPVALGEINCCVELSYPESDTWLGSTNAGVIKNLASTQKLIREKVEQRKVDDYLKQIEHKQTLIKIDTEGNELSILRGAMKMIQEIKPMIIFECWRDSVRLELFNFFEAQNYKIHCIPWRPDIKSQPLESKQFIDSSSTNFIAVPI